jgi:hypothetical protein
VLVERLEVCTTPFERMRGLLGRTSLEPGRGMFLAPCKAVHTFLMRFPIDLVVIDKGFSVITVKRLVRPGSVFLAGWRAWAVVEIESGWLGQDAVAPGDRVSMSATARSDDAT